MNMLRMFKEYRDLERALYDVKFNLGVARNENKIHLEKIGELENPCNFSVGEKVAYMESSCGSQSSTFIFGKEYDETPLTVVAVERSTTEVSGWNLTLFWKDDIVFKDKQYRNKKYVEQIIKVVEQKEDIILLKDRYEFHNKVCNSYIDNTLARRLAEKLLEENYVKNFIQFGLNKR